MMDNHEENVDEEIVEEYGSTPVDLERMHNHYYLGNEVRLNFIDPSIRDIPAEAYQNYTALTDLRVLPWGRRRIILRTIGERAFCRCIKLRRINQFLKDGGVLRLEDEAFASCWRLVGELVIPSSVLWVGDACFQECFSITSVVFETSTTGTVVEIKFAAFNNCTKLSSATLPPTLECIPWSCFNRCTALVYVPIPPTVVEVGEDAFADCISLSLMDLPESVDDIGRKAFYNCTALTTVTIRTASFDLRMGDGVFDRCDSLSKIRTYLWHWGKLLSSMDNDANFLDKFFNGALASSINLYSCYGAHILEAMNEQPSLFYRVLRTFQHQRFETNAPRTAMTAQNTTNDRIEE